MSDGPKLTWLGRLAILLFLGACGYGAWLLFAKKPLPALGGPAPSQPASRTDSQPQARTGGGPAVEIGIAYGTEKRRWLEWAAAEYAKSREGRNTTVNLIPMGSIEGANAILGGDERIHVWSPASALYKDVFVSEWEIKHGGKPILREEALALSPMVFVMWAPRYDAFVARYGSVNFESIAKAIAEPGGWDAIAGKPEWGLFKFGHTHPNESNSGLMTLVLMAYRFSGKTRGLELKDILNPAFQPWLAGIERGVSGLSNSTGNMMREMVLKGPSSFDALFVYENVVIDYLKNAEGRWGELRVAYPDVNMWNENPYYILDAPWSSPAQRKAAGAFADFLLSEPIQKQALVHGFRPGNPAVPVIAPDSPFSAYERFGLKVELSKVAEPPKAEVLQNLLAMWQRANFGR